MKQKYAELLARLNKAEIYFQGLSEDEYLRVINQRDIGNKHPVKLLENIIQDLHKAELLLTNEEKLDVLEFFY